MSRLLALALASCALAAAPAPREGWTPLFDGKNLDAWQKAPADKWKIEDGVLAWQKGCGNLWTKEKYGDFTLDLEYKVGDNSNSGIFLRSPEGEKNWLQGSIEIQVATPSKDGKVSKHTTGSVYDCLEPSVFAEKTPGEWNRMVITFVGNSLKVALNDKPIIDADLNKWTEAHKNPDGSKNKFNTAYKDMAKSGHLGLQDHGQTVWYRNIKIKAMK
jgi:hypothetical protein